MIKKYLNYLFLQESIWSEIEDLKKRIRRLQDIKNKRAAEIFAKKELMRQYKKAGKIPAYVNSKKFNQLDKEILEGIEEEILRLKRLLNKKQNILKISKKSAIIGAAIGVGGGYILSKKLKKDKKSEK